jgi:hypothetical protein
MIDGQKKVKVKGTHSIRREEPFGRMPSAYLVWGLFLLLSVVISAGLSYYLPTSALVRTFVVPFSVIPSVSGIVVLGLGRSIYMLRSSGRLKRTEEERWPRSYWFICALVIMQSMIYAAILISAILGS